METQVMTREEFADFLKICLTTESEWRDKGILAEGVHYLKVQRTVRYFLNDDLIKRLLDINQDPDGEED